MHPIAPRETKAHSASSEKRVLLSAYGAHDDIGNAGSATRPDVLQTPDTAARLQTPAAASPAPANSALRTTFDKYDVDRDGMLNQKEVLMMMQDLRFEVDGEYLKGVLQTFGRYDKDKSGAIDWGPEFEALCACATCFRT
eukprot:SAG31_NODE_6005_length_2217_cov_10.084986_2_plen_140_part_00